MLTWMIGTCPQCRRPMRVWLRHRGKTVRCPRCKAAVRVPVSITRTGDR